MIEIQLSFVYQPAKYAAAIVCNPKYQQAAPEPVKQMPTTADDDDDDDDDGDNSTDDEQTITRQDISPVMMSQDISPVMTLQWQCQAINERRILYPASTESAVDMTSR